MVEKADEWALCGLPVVERCKAEIRDDVKAGRVPRTVGSFGELHDHVDANEYGGACESDGENAFDGSDEATYFWNRVQCEVDAWIKAGGLKSE